MIHCAGVMRLSGPLRRQTKANSTMTRVKSAVAPASMIHHSVARLAARGPAGSSVESSPVQPASASGVAHSATNLKQGVKR